MSWEWVDQSQECVERLQAEIAELKTWQNRNQRLMDFKQECINGHIKNAIERNYELAELQESWYSLQSSLESQRDENRELKIEGIRNISLIHDFKPLM